MLTADGICAGFDLVYYDDIPFRVYDTNNQSITAGAITDLGPTDLSHIVQVKISPDANDSDYLAVYMEIENSKDRGTTTSTITCGNYQPLKATDMICNPYSSVIGVSGVADSTNGALTELTVGSVPVFGGVSAAQLSAYQELDPPVPPTPWFDTLNETIVTAAA